MREFSSLALKEEAQIGAARRAVHFFARQTGFSERALAEIDLVVQEIGTNAVRYAGNVGGDADNGATLYYTTPLGARVGLELFYSDRGPGIYDLDRAINDGVSMGGSLGGGLGAINRQMDEFEIYSTVRAGTTRLSLYAAQQRRTTHGTAILCRKWLSNNDRAMRTAHAGIGRITPAREDFAVRIGEGAHLGVWSRPRPGEQANGDAYFTREYDGQLLFAVIDGLGHGGGAQQAATAAQESLDEWNGESLEEIFLSAHQALRATRGAVMGAVIIDRTRRQMQYAGIGNIEVRVFENGLTPVSPVHFVPVNGTLGIRLDRVRVWNYEWQKPPIIVLTSDGISASWDIKAYPGITDKDPQILAGVLLRDYSREADDATALVIRLE